MSSNPNSDPTEPKATASKALVSITLENEEGNITMMFDGNSVTMYLDLSTTVSSFLKEDGVLDVERLKEHFALIMTILQESLEDYFVATVTKPSDSSTTTGIS